MVKVFALKIELTAVLLTHPLCVIEGRRATYIIFKQRMILLLKLCALDYGQICLLKVVNAFVENLRYVSPSKLSIETVFVNLIISHIYVF